MKKIILITFLLATVVGFSQEKIVEKLDTFDELKVFSGLQVNLIKSKEQKIEIIGERASEVIFKNRNRKLKISLKLKSFFDSKNVKINLYYNSNIAELDANQAAVITSKDVFKQTQLELNSQDKAYIKLKVDVDYLKIKAITGANIQLKGKTKSQIAKITSGGNYEAFDLVSNQATVYVTSGGEAEVSAIDALDAKVKLGGTIVYKGKTKSIKTEKSLGGSIKEYKLGNN